MKNARRPRPGELRKQKPGVEKKIAAIEASGMPIAYDGCHKIYFLTDKAHEDECASFGYAPFHPSTDLRKLIAVSCMLVFVSKWGHNNDDFAHEFNIRQGEIAL